MSECAVDLDTFIARHMESLERDQARHNLLLGLLARVKNDPTKARLWSLGDGTRCALQTPPHNIVLGDLTKQDCKILVTAIKDLEFKGCIGAEETPGEFCKALQDSGVRMKLGMLQRIHVLRNPPKFPVALGSGRCIEEKDRRIYADWAIKFVVEANPHEKPPTHPEMEKRALDQPAFLWEADGIPVSMAARTRETKDGSNISYVYTQPEFRGKGYGGSVTALACENVFRGGKKVAFLYTDLSNPISNRVYQKIGFEPWCDASIYLRNP